MKFIIDAAREYVEDIDMFSFKAENVKGDLERFSNRVHNLEHKKLYLNKIISFAKEKDAAHRLTCKSDPDKCFWTQSYEVIQYFAEQEIQAIEKQPIHSSGFGNYPGSIFISGDNNIVASGHSNISGNINLNLEKLNSSGKEDISGHLQKLTEAIMASDDLNEEEKIEHLEDLEFLSEEATKEEQDRSKKSVIKRMIKGGLEKLHLAGSLSSIWSVAGTAIKAYFGIG